MDCAFTIQWIWNIEKSVDSQDCVSLFQVFVSIVLTFIDQHACTYASTILPWLCQAYNKFSALRLFLGFILGGLNILRICVEIVVPVSIKKTC